MSSEPGQCERTDCTAPARFRPRLDFYPAPTAAVPFYGGPPGTVDIGLRTCAEHATEEMAHDLLLTFLPMVFRVADAAGRAAPDVERSRVVWEPIQ